jgi:hypothetical protein
VSRPLVTDAAVRGLEFARACVLDQRASSRARADHSWDTRYQEALAAIDEIVRAHEKSKKGRSGE